MCLYTKRAVVCGGKIVCLFRFIFPLRKFVFLLQNLQCVNEKCMYKTYHRCVNYTASDSHIKSISAICVCFNCFNVCAFVYIACHYIGWLRLRLTNIILYIYCHRAWVLHLLCSKFSSFLLLLLCYWQIAIYVQQRQQQPQQ